MLCINLKTLLENNQQLQLINVFVIIYCRLWRAVNSTDEFLHLFAQRGKKQQLTYSECSVSADRWSVSTSCLAATTKMKGREKQAFDEVCDLLSQDLAATQTHAGDVSIMFSSVLAGWFTDKCGTDFMPRN